MFPYHEVPDDAVMAPHHYIYGLIIVAVMLAVVWDDYRQREPLLAAFGMLTGLFGFIFVWPWYHSAGAILSILGPIVTILAVGLGWLGLSVGDTWDNYPVRWRVGVILGSLIAMDDVIEHAFGWPTPLDYVWKNYLLEDVTILAVVLFAIILIAVVFATVYTGDKETGQ